MRAPRDYEQERDISFERDEDIDAVIEIPDQDDQSDDEENYSTEDDTTQVSIEDEVDS